jgi:cytochrome c
VSRFYAQYMAQKQKLHPIEKRYRNLMRKHLKGEQLSKDDVEFLEFVTVVERMTYESLYKKLHKDIKKRQNTSSLIKLMEALQDDG